MQTIVKSQGTIRTTSSHSSTLVTKVHDYTHETHEELSKQFSSGQSISSDDHAQRANRDRERHATNALTKKQKQKQINERLKQKR